MQSLPQPLCDPKVGDLSLKELLKRANPATATKFTKWFNQSPESLSVFSLTLPDQLYGVLAL